MGTGQWLPGICGRTAAAWLSLLLSSVAGVVQAAEIYIGHPQAGNYRVDICYEWGMQCGGEAADMWCKSNGYTRAVEWEIEHDIGATSPTMVIGSGQVCAEAHCDGYFSIACAREDAWTQSTGHGGMVVTVERTSQVSPEGILVIAVSEQDPSQATAAVIGVNGLAFLHTPPGKWRVFAVDFNNPLPIKPQPGFTAEVQTGKDGEYLTLMPD